MIEAVILLCLAGHPAAPDPCERHRVGPLSPFACLRLPHEFAAYAELRGFRIERVTCK